MKLVTRGRPQFSSSLDLRDTLVKVGRRLTPPSDVPTANIDLGSTTPSYRLMNVIGEAVEAALVPHPIRPGAVTRPCARPLETARARDRRSLDDPRLTPKAGPPIARTARRAG